MRQWGASIKSDRARAKRRGRRKLLGFVLGTAGFALAGGFVVFASHVDGLDVPSAIPKADGIVVWTGKGGGRLETAGTLLSDGLGERLLISGVNQRIDLAQVAELAGLNETQSACCVDLDYAALDTRGNARETAAWAEALGYDHILLVTSAYHMPRARLDIAHEAGRIRITPIPVAPPDQADWWRDTERFRRLAGEYGKYLVSLSRGRADEPDGELVLPELDKPQP